MNLTPEEHVAQLEKNKNIVCHKIVEELHGATGREIVDALTRVAVEHSCPISDIQLNVTANETISIEVVDWEKTVIWRRNHMIVRAPSDQWK